MADRLGGELERHFQRSLHKAEHDFVFGHPRTGDVLDASKLPQRFGTQMAAAGAPLRAIQEWMGHADAKTTEI